MGSGHKASRARRNVVCFKARIKSLETKRNFFVKELDGVICNILIFFIALDLRVFYDNVTKSDFKNPTVNGSQTVF